MAANGEATVEQAERIFRGYQVLVIGLAWLHPENLPTEQYQLA